jgi:hypothetical protein
MLDEKRVRAAAQARKECIAADAMWKQAPSGGDVRKEFESRSGVARGDCRAEAR